MRSLFIAFVFALVPFPALGDTVQDAIQSYNSAKASGKKADRLDAARTLGAVAIENPEHADAQLLVFEAAQTLCLGNECSDAIGMVDWLETAPGALPGVEPANETLLIAFVRWSDKATSKTRKALDAALENASGLSPNLLTVTAFQMRYVKDMQSNKWSKAKVSAAEAADYFEPVKDVIGFNWSDARTSAHVATFNHLQNTDPVVELANHEAELERMRRAYSDAGEDYPDWIDDHRHRASAWRMAMMAYFDSSGSQGQRRADDLRKRTDAVLASVAVNKEAESQKTALPFCDGEFDMRPRLKYPSGAAIRGMFGAAIMDITVTDGKVSDVKALAAVPYDGFKEKAAKTIMQWSWITEDEGAGETCRMSKANIILPLVFALR